MLISDFPRSAWITQARQSILNAEKDGGHGQAWKRHGKNGKPFLAKVPPGTLVYRSTARTVTEAVKMERSEAGIDLELVADLTTEDEELVLCKAGTGGKGNWQFRSSTNRTPEEFTLGTEGEEGVFYVAGLRGRVPPRPKAGAALACCRDCVLLKLPPMV